MLAKALGSPLPDILYDGIVDPKKQVDGKLPDALAIRIHDNGKAGFANFDAPGLKAVAAEGQGKRRTSSATSRHTKARCRRWRPSRSRA